MRFLLNHSRNYLPDSRIANGLGKALMQAGHEVHLPKAPPDTRSSDVYSGMDVAIEINHPRDDAVPRGVVHIDWIQDYPQGYDGPVPDDCCLPHDLIYTFGDGMLIGIPTENWEYYGPLIGEPRASWKHYAGSLLT